MGPKGKDDMNVAVLAERAVRDVMNERNVKKPFAREIVAREAGLIGPGTLENLAKGRLANVRLIEEALRRYAVKRLRSKLAALEHDFHLARAAAGGADDPDLDAVEAHLRAVKTALGQN